MSNQQNTPGGRWRPIRGEHVDEVFETADGIRGFIVRDGLGFTACPLVGDARSFHSREMARRHVETFDPFAGIEVQLTERGRELLAVGGAVR